jgi:hypothetical protein
MLRVQDQAKQATHTGPPISNSLSVGWPSISMGPQVGHKYLKQTRLRLEVRQRKATDHMRVKIMQKYT